jgi:sugar phosphate isomerase/epimerase
MKKINDIHVHLDMINKDDITEYLTNLCVDGASKIALQSLVASPKREIVDNLVAFRTKLEFKKMPVYVFGSLHECDVYKDVPYEEQIETLLRECPNVKLLFDVGHLTVAGGDVEYIGNKYYDRIVAYHFKGWQTSDTPDHENWTRRGHFCGLGQGDFFVNNEAVFKNAVSRGFNGWMFIEHDTHLRDPLLDLKESYDIMKKWEREALVK